MSFEANQLNIDGTIVELEKPIYSVKEISDLVIVVFDESDYAKDDNISDRNVIAVERNGNVLWRIRNSLSATHGQPGRTAPFSGVEVRRDREKELLVAYDAAGMCYEVDLTTGEISSPRVSK